MTDHAAARLGTSPRRGFASDVVVAGSPATTRQDVAYALAAIFPRLRFAAVDIECHGGCWLIPVPSQVARLVRDAGQDFAWTEAVEQEGGECLVSVFVPAP